MIASLIARLIALGVPARAARPLLILAALAFVWSGFTIWQAVHDRKVTRQHDARVNAEALTRARKADSLAAEHRRAADARLAAEHAELERIVSHGTDAKNPVSDTRRAYLRCVRLQQTARKSGEPVPACK